MVLTVHGNSNRTITARSGFALDLVKREASAGLFLEKLCDEVLRLVAYFLSHKRGGGGQGQGAQSFRSQSNVYICKNT